jgi:hypothetical protein
VVGRLDDGIHQRDDGRDPQHTGRTDRGRGLIPGLVGGGFIVGVIVH